MKKSYMGIQRQLAVISFCSGTLLATACHAAPTIPGFVGNAADVLPQSQLPATALPSGGTIVQGVDSIRNLSPSQLEIKQSAPKAVIHWEHFNIGEKAGVNFDQKGNSSWKALNTIGDASPSQILGKLTADGGVYLINQNGILIGPNAQVNVHDFTASSLNLKPADFISGYTKTDSQELTFQNDDGSPGGKVENRGLIQAKIGGAVMLLGGEVENSGSIQAPQGQVVLAAGCGVSLKDSQILSRNLANEVAVSGDEGRVTNQAAGSIETEEGMAGMYGAYVNQLGRISSVTAVQRNGQVELVASKRVSTGAASVTATPVSDSPERQGVAGFLAGRISVTAPEIDLGGAIVSPGGKVDITAIAPSDAQALPSRIVMESGSSIDVSGVTVNETSADRIIPDLQLNSEELKDSPVLKQGPLLGQKVKVDILSGMPTADLSGYLNGRLLSAAERLTNGGTITMMTPGASSAGPGGAIEVRPGARLSFAGGGIQYAGGALDLTKVRVGNKIYTLADLPAGTQVDEVLGKTERVHERYGVTDVWKGIYNGGATPVSDSVAATFVGGNAGTLSILTPYLSLRGTLDGHALAGLTQIDDHDPVDALGRPNALGHMRPLGGTLGIGISLNDVQKPASELDAVTEAIVVTAATSGNDSPAANGGASRQTVIGADTLNAAQLSQLRLYANTTLKVEAGVRVKLTPDGTFEAMARQLDMDGAIIALGGSVTLAVASDITSFQTINSAANSRFLPLEERVSIGRGGTIDVSGQVIDNTGIAVDQVRYGILQGGSIDISNRASSTNKADASYNPNRGGWVTINPFATLAARGGYWRGTSGRVTGGNAGSVSISTSNNTDPIIILDGELEGDAPLGNSGGTLKITALSLAVAPGGRLPDGSGGKSALSDPRNTLVLADNRFAKTGFSNITLGAVNDLTVFAGASLTPSLLRLVPADGVAGGAATATKVEAQAYEAGATRLSLVAGSSGGTNSLAVEPGTDLTVMPGGTIELTGGTLCAITMAGSLAAPAGTIKVTGKDITVTGDGRLLAAGTVLPVPVAVGPGGSHVNQRTLGNGTINLSAQGNIEVAAGAKLDVSGSPRGVNLLPDEDVGFYSRDEAAGPGTLAISYVGNLDLAGDVAANASLAGLAGGTLSITRDSVTELFTPDTNLLAKLKAVGFDDITLAAPKTGIKLDGGTQLEVGRALTLDTPRLVGGSRGQATLAAPWLKVINSGDNTVLPTAVPGMAASLSAHADFLDLQGNVVANGFRDVNLSAEHDIRLADHFYNNPNKGWSGQLATDGDLTLTGAAVYPQTNCNFTITSGGRFTVLAQPAAERQPIYSAGGSLTVEAKDIDVQGLLAAPMGELRLLADGGRLQLAPGSRLSTRGEANVAYGSLQYGVWRADDKSGQNVNDSKEVKIPTGSIGIEAGEIVAMPGSLVDAGAGGSVSGREFQPGLDGTVDPLTKSGRLIILADNSVVLPGKAVYVEANEALGLKAGVYSVLPESFAFLPNALVLERYGSDAVVGRNGVNKLNQPVVAGYETYLGTDIRPAAMTGYTLRTAADVLKEGKFDLKRLASVDGGTITVSAPSVVLAGTISAPAVAGGQGGSLTAAGRIIHYGPLPSVPLPTRVDAILPSDLAGGLFVDATALEGAGLSRLTLGDAGTKGISLAADSRLTGIPQVTLTTSGDIHIAKGAVIDATSQLGIDGALTLEAATLTTEQDSKLHTSGLMTWKLAKGMDQKGEWDTDSGSLHVGTDNLFLGGGKDMQPRDGNGDMRGVLLSDADLRKLANSPDLQLTSRGDITFMKDLDLGIAGRLTLDGQRLLVIDSARPGQGVHLAATEARLMNGSGSPSAEVSALATGHDLAVEAGHFTLGPGTMRLDGFRDVSLTSLGAMLFQGKAGLDARLEKDGTLALTAESFRADFPASGLDFTASSLAISAPQATVAFRGAGAEAAFLPAARVPGTLSVVAEGIALSDARFGLPGGVIDLRATGKNGIDISGHSLLDTSGTSFPVLPSEKALPGEAPQEAVLPGGHVRLIADQGDVNLGLASGIDVSGLGKGEAGLVELSAAAGKVKLDGGLRGMNGGSLALDSGSIDDFGALGRQLSTGGFTEEVDLRLRAGDISIGQGQTILAHRIIMAADQGSIAVQGELGADGATGGQVALYAGRDLLLNDGAAVHARGVDGDATGGDIVLASASGAIETKVGSVVDVTGRAGNGTVTFRLPRTGNTVPLTANGQILGSRRTAVQAVATYSGDTVTTANVTTWKSDANTFMAKASALAGMILVPEVEVRAAGDMVLASGLDTLSTWRSGGLPGVLTFRSAGDLKVETNVIDAPTLLSGSQRLIVPNGLVDSCGLNFVAGADLTAADSMQTVNSTGNLNFGKDGAALTVYTESAPIRFASGNTTTVYAPGSTTRNYMPGVQSYTVASFDGSITGRTGGDLDLRAGGVLQTATGDIRLDIVGSLDLGEAGAIRTAGRPPEWSEVPQWLVNYKALPATRATTAESQRLGRYWDYRDGGSIEVAAGAIDGRISADGGNWDSVTKEKDLTNYTKETNTTYHWGALYTKNISTGLTGTTGIAAMAGGDVSLAVEGDIRGQAAVFGPGDLTAVSKGDLDGRFLAVNGDLKLSAYGNFGGKDRDVPVETGGGSLAIQTLGGIGLGVIDNPGIFNSYIDSIGLAYNLGYTEHSVASLTAANGDVVLTGATLYCTTDQQSRGHILPPSLSIVASRDIDLQANDWLMVPAAQGKLQLVAGRDLSGAYSLDAGKMGQGQLLMSDADPAVYLGTFEVYAGDGTVIGLAERGTRRLNEMISKHRGPVLHANDDSAVIVHAGRDIADLSLLLPKRAVLRAERDIRDIQYVGQNIGAADVSLVSVGQDLSQTMPTNFAQGYSSRSLQQGGPGYFVVQAGNDMDLGVSEPKDLYGLKSYGGIVTYGGEVNSHLKTENSELGMPKGSDVAVIVGYDFQPSPEAISTFIADLRQESRHFSELRASNDTAGAAAVKEAVRQGLMQEFLGGRQTGDGVLNMTSSTINTKSGDDSISIITAGPVNVGLSAVKMADTEAAKSKDSGIFTTSGGAINIVAGGDINVNESRVMSFLGGDLLLLSDHGNINAGRGARTTVIAAPPKVVQNWVSNNNPNDPNDGYWVPKTVFQPPAAGSGLRTLAYDPDGNGPLLAPPPGDMYVVAWDGVVDAGEAGIEGKGKLWIGATQVLNVQNINGGAGSVGMPAATSAPAGLTALSGSSMGATESTVSDIVKETASATSSAAEQIAQTAKKIAEALGQIRVFVVKFMGFIE